MKSVAVNTIHLIKKCIRNNHQTYSKTQPKNVIEIEMKPPKRKQKKTTTKYDRFTTQNKMKFVNEKAWDHITKELSVDQGASMSNMNSRSK